MHANIKRTGGFSYLGVRVARESSQDAGCFCCLWERVQMICVNGCEFTREEGGKVQTNEGGALERCFV